MGDREDREPTTTSGTIAVANPHAQIGGLAARVLGAAPVPAAAHMLMEEALILIDLLTLRGHVLGRIADYERAAELAEQLVRGTPDDCSPGYGPLKDGPCSTPGMGDAAEAERLFTEARRRYQGISPFPASSDDPEYAARLACALDAAGQRREAGQWRISAAARYDELALRHPEAFADHAADFRRANPRGACVAGSGAGG